MSDQEVAALRAVRLRAVADGTPDWLRLARERNGEWSGDMRGVRHPESGGLIFFSGEPPAANIMPRDLFLDAIRWNVPLFWAFLNELWRGGDEERIRWWMGRIGVVDEWLKAVVWDTVGYWMQHPDSPRAKLEPGHRWFYYKEVDEAKSLGVPVFAPQLGHPYPLGGEMDQQPAVTETVDEFEKRMQIQFAAELKRYSNWWRQVLGDNFTEMQKHAEWTALFAFGGKRYAELGKWPGLGQSHRPDKVVEMAVRRFSERIGFTLPRVRRKR